MAGVNVTAQERASIARSMRHGKRARQTWQREGRKIMAKYGGQWIAFFDGRIVAAARTASLLDVKLDRLKLDRKDIIVRYAPRPTDRFAL